MVTQDIPKRSIHLEWAPCSRMDSSDVHLEPISTKDTQRKRYSIRREYPGTSKHGTQYSNPMKNNPSQPPGITESKPRPSQIHPVWPRYLDSKQWSHPLLKIHSTQHGTQLKSQHSLGRLVNLNSQEVSWTNLLRQGFYWRETSPPHPSLWMWNNPRNWI